MMFRVMELHDLCTDDRLQGIVVIGQVGQRVLAATGGRTQAPTAPVEQILKLGQEHSVIIQLSVSAGK